MRNTDLPTITVGRSLALPYEMKEAFNSLKINLNFTAEDASVIMITSSMSGEGKSFISMHILKTLADSGKRVCLVDTDMRRSSMVKDYLISSECKILGLSHYLSGQTGLSDILYRVENIERAYFISCGAYVVDPTILLENNRFSILMTNLKNNFDFVIVDCAPIGLVSDAKIISKSCDGALMVIKSSVISKLTAKATARKLEESGCRLIGYILNCKKRHNGSYYKKKYYRYDHYYTSEETNEKA